MGVSRRTPHSPWRRHELLEIAPHAWRRILHGAPSAGPLLVEGWAARGWPVIVRRRSETEYREFIPVGLPLPRGSGVRRMSLLVAPRDVLRRSSPAPLETTAGTADQAWRKTIDSLVAIGAGAGVEPLTIGSLLWQHLTGLAYLTPESDLDVLWPVHPGVDVRSLVRDIAAVERDAPLRIDGEVVFPDGTAVNWRELREACRAAEPHLVMTKTIDGVRLLEVPFLAGVGGLA